ncbi:N-acetyltransferase family protein [Chitinibacter bivalviorum]|uniref:N-acetyltransferase family protein n=1 Tax=Chitinibacter bivalviorum TaxID=2739434 RepID=A0A7H9BKE9_9NEIS|nr:GNAT family N-acetyltransferase [Chitinibacter bivalviorum]QLG89043.1 N-acetyltransferase family protein [Chitinibacter bivalviorum]
MNLVHCTYERHASAILAILNDAIIHSTALYDYQPRSIANMQTWFATKQAGDFPVIGLEDERGELMGFASYGAFRAFPAYKYTVEHAIYVAQSYRGRGLGEQLLRLLIEQAQAQGKHVLVGAIDADNAGSIALHQKLGFTHSGTLPQVGFKFGRWLDLVFYQLILATPEMPVDG